MKKYRYGKEIFECRPGNCPGWQRVTTVHGTCCAFNYHPLGKANASVLNQEGLLGGMDILFAGEEASSLGAILIITQPGSYITHSVESFNIVPGFDNFFGLYLTNEIYSSDYEKLPLRLRRCFLVSDGKPSLVFQTRCLLLCAAKNAHDKCNCHPYFLPIIEPAHKSVRSCNVGDTMCIRTKAGIKMYSKSLESSFILQ